MRHPSHLEIASRGGKTTTSKYKAKLSDWGKKGQETAFRNDPAHGLKLALAGLEGRYKKGTVSEEVYMERRSEYCQRIAAIESKHLPDES